MNSSRVLGAAAALALIVPLITPTASFAQRAHGGGGGVAFGAAGGGRMGGGHFAASPAMRGGGSFGAVPAMRSTGPVVGAGRVAAAAPSGTWNRGSWNGGAWNGGHWNHRHGGFWPGVAAGAAIGALGSYAYYGGDPYYYGDPDYYSDGYYDDSATVAVGPDVGGDSAAYCAQRYRSYDPASGTYLGYDGLRHPCP